MRLLLQFARRLVKLAYKVPGVCTKCYYQYVKLIISKEISNGYSRSDPRLRMEYSCLYKESNYEDIIYG